MMSMAKILQILLSYEEICICKCTLKLKSQTDLRKSLYMATYLLFLRNSASSH